MFCILLHCISLRLASWTDSAEKERGWLGLGGNARQSSEILLSLCDCRRAGREQADLISPLARRPGSGDASSPLFPPLSPLPIAGPTALQNMVASKPRRPTYPIVPFSDETPTHPLLVVDFEQVKAGDKDAIDTLFKACSTLGFFCTSLQTSSPEL